MLAFMLHLIAAVIAILVSGFVLFWVCWLAFVVVGVPIAAAFDFLAWLELSPAERQARRAQKQARRMQKKTGEAEQLQKWVQERRPELVNAPFDVQLGAYKRWNFKGGRR